MRCNPLGGLLIGAALGTVSTLAAPVFNSGVASFIFDPGDGNTTTVTANPIPAGGPVTQLSASNPGPLAATGAAGMWHLESPSMFGVNVPGGSGVSQSDTSGNANGAATVTINFTATWDMAGQFGPVAFGYAIFPNISGVVGSGPGSFVQFEVQANWTGGATRAPVNFNYVNSTPGPFSTSLFDTEVMTPNFIANGASETISGLIRFSARGIGDESSVGLAQLAGTTPVPEPEEWAAVGGAGLLAFGAWRRSRRP